MLSRRSIWCSLVGLAACQPDMPALDLTASPTRIDGRGSSTTITVTAIQRMGVPGAGTVRLSSQTGTFVTPKTVTLDSVGNATETFTCTTASEPTCSGRVTIVGDWLAKGMAVSSQVSVQISPSAGGGSTGTGGGSTGTGGGSTGTGGGSTGTGGGSAGTGGGSTGTGGGSTGTGGGATGTGGGSTGTGGGSTGTGGGATAGGASGTSGGSSGTGGGASGGGSSGGTSAAGGTTGSAGGAAGGSPLRYAPPALNPAAVAIIGVLRPSACEGAVAPIDAGTTPFVGVPCALVPERTFLRPDGGFIYQHPSTLRLFAAQADPLGVGANGWTYPASLANDLDVTPGCSGTVSRFLLRPSNGSVVGQCVGGAWMEGTTVLSNLANENLVAFALTGEALVARPTGTVIISGSTVTPVTLPSAPVTKMTRATPTGFLTVLTSPTCSLYSISLSGTATKVGDYTTTGIATAPCNGRIDANGVLYFGTANIGGTVIGQRPLTPGTSSYVYANTTATVWDFGPRFNLIVVDGNGLVTGL